MRLNLYSRFLPAGFLLLMFSAGYNVSYAQARIVFGATADAYIVMSSNAVIAGNPIYLVIGDATGNSDENTITRTTNGGIITNGENNLIKWYIGNGTGQYKIPYCYSTIASLASNYIPFTFDITGAGTANRYMQFSTFRTGWQNSAMMPTGVLNCNSAGFGDVSHKMVDRFWQIDNSNYAAKPTGDLTFYYVDGGGTNPEVTTTGNSFTEADLEAESYNGSSNLWAGATYGSADDANNFVVTAPDNIAQPFFFRWWALVDKNFPLPVTWLNVVAECNRGDVTVKWSTASEQNSDYFTVERSYDGTNFTDLANVLAAGQSSTVKNYSYVDEDPIKGVSYYRIRETDFNSSTMVSVVMTVNGCSNDDIFIYGNEGGISVNINATEEGPYTFELYDLLGQRLMNEIKMVSAGDNHLKLSVSNISSAIYVAKVYSGNNVVSKKVFIRSAYSR